jgi:C4-dicarboxylate-specific signal transduction histidine kinase
MQKLLSNRGGDQYECRIMHPDGSVRHVVAFAKVAVDETGDPTKMYGTVQDITARKILEQETSKLRDELFLATRRMSMGELSSAIAHELNQPLAAILSNAHAARRFLKRDTPLLEEVEEILDDIISDDRRAADIIIKLRGMLKKERHDFEDISINEVIREVLALTRNHLLIKMIELKTSFAEGTPPVSGDRTQLQQVFLNLVLNASEALGDAGTGERKISIETEELGDSKVRIRVSDTGPGLGDAEKNMLFDPFYTTKKEGMGIGLSICKTIVEHHDGRIGVEKNPEGGGTFYVELPRAGEK